MHIPKILLTFALGNNKEKIMKQIYVEEIRQDGIIACVGLAFTSKAKAREHCLRLFEEQETATLFDDESGFGVNYRANGVRVTICMQAIELR